MERSEAFYKSKEIERNISICFSLYEDRECHGVQDWEGKIRIKLLNAFDDIAELCRYVIDTNDFDYFRDFISATDDILFNIMLEITNDKYPDLIVGDIGNRYTKLQIMLSHTLEYLNMKETDTHHWNARELHAYESVVGRLFPIKEENETDKPSLHFNCTLTDEQLTSIFDALKQANFIASNSILEDWLYICKGGTDRATTQKIIWTAKNTKNRGASKKSLLDLLVSMGIKKNDINPETINGCFAVEGAKEFILQDLPPICKDWKEETKSEYHDQIKAIVSESKQKQKKFL